MEDPAMKKRGILFVVLLCLILMPSCAGQIIIQSAQKDYYFLTGEDAVLPLTLNNTYSHDIPGVLRSTTVAENPGGSGTTVQEKAFTMFTGQRLYLLPAGRSDTPLTLHAGIVFFTPENGGRRASLDDIVIHFVKDPADIQAIGNPQEGTDSPDPSAVSAGSMSVPGKTNPPADPLQRLQNNQPRDMQSLQQQMQKDDAELLRQKREFLSLLMLDPTIASLDRSLVNAGFALTGPEVSPLTNTSGNFSFSYEKESQSAVVHGSVDEGRLRFADESSRSTVPLPEVLRDNATFRTLERELETSGFLRNATLVHATPGAVMVNLTYGDTKSRVIYLNAAIANGTITSIGQETLSEPSLFPVPLLSVVLICLLSGGILILSRRLPRATLPAAEPPGPEPAPPLYRTLAATMLDEADAMADQGLFPDAYARAGQVLRLILSHEMSDGREMTNEEVFRMLSRHYAGDDRRVLLLERCGRVAFAKESPDPEEFKRMLKFLRRLLTPEEGNKNGP
jgi:hypothetical protein